MYDFLIIHGSLGSPTENWFPWLIKKLEDNNKTVLAPQFPTIEQNFENWERVLKSYDEHIGETTSIIAHSLAPAFILDYLIKNKKSVKNLYLIAPFYGLIDTEEFDKVNKTFFMYPDLSEAKSYFKKAHCFFSDNDPYVPQKMSTEFSTQIGGNNIIIEGGKHLNTNAGFEKFDKLLIEIEKYS